MTRRVLTLSLFAVAACQEPAKSCTADDECGAGAQCIEKLCVLSTGGSGGGGTAGGRAGGTAGGSSGGTAGGGTSGGTAGGTAGGGAGGTGGGTAGGGTAGGVATCPARCEAWEVCEAPTCVPLTVAFITPDAGTRYDAGQAGVLIVETRLRGVVYAFDAGLALDAGAGFPLPPTALPSVATGFTAPSAAGQYTLTAGWAPPGPSATTSIDVVSCATATCTDFFACTPTTGGGVCEAVPLTVRWVTPATDAVEVNSANRNVTLVVAVDAMSGQYPASLPLSGAMSGTLMRVAPFDGGTYSAVVTLPNPDGPKQLRAGWTDAGTAYLATRTVTLDTQAPGVTVEVQPRGALGDADPAEGGAWKKDEKALVKVTVDAGRLATVNDLLVPWDGGVTLETGCNACTAGCQCFGVNLARAPVNGLKGTAWLQVAAIGDMAGNSSAVQDAGVSVTRFKWTRDITLLAGSTRINPVAVSRSGVVIAAVEEAPLLNPRVVAYAQDGGFLWGEVRSGTVTAGPMVGALPAGADVWVATQASGRTALQPIGLLSGTSGPAACDPLSVIPFTGDLALSSLNGGLTEVPFGIRNGFVQGPSSGICPAQELTGAADTTARPNLVVQASAGITEVFATYDGDTQFWKANLTGTTWTPQGVASLPSGTQPRGLFFDGMGRVGGGGGVVGNGALFTTPDNVPLDAGTPFTSIAAANAGPPSLGSGFLLYGTSSGQISKVLYNPATGAMSAGPVVAGGVGNLQATSPVLGRGGLAYLVGVTGSLTVRRVSDVSEAWNASLATLSGSGVVSQPALDVYRTALGAKDCSKPLGVLYVLTKSGATATLRAILVDSQGLDSAAPWPKYQRDNSNTGNASLPFDSWVCP